MDVVWYLLLYNVVPCVTLRDLPGTAFAVMPLLVIQFLMLDTDPCIARNRCSNKCIAANDRIMADHGLSAKNRSTRIYGYIVLYGWMAFLPIQLMATSGG